MIRLDAYISWLARYSRSDIRKLIRAWEVFVDDKQIQDGSLKVVDGQEIKIFEKSVVVKETVTILLYKPSGFVCSNIDEGGHASWKHLITDCPYQAMLEVAGRLDFDTEGLLVTTSDGQLAHRLISPKRKLPKTYLVQCKNSLTREDCLKLEAWITLEDGYVTMPATCILLDNHSCRLTIHEGKYHQIKRMMIMLGNEVAYLKREQFGEWNLEWLEKGEWSYII
jgi:16S rRNA pseudouridine516 synthase